MRRGRARVAVERLRKGREVDLACELLALDHEEDEARRGKRDGDDVGRCLQKRAERELERQPAGNDSAAGRAKRRAGYGQVARNAQIA